MKQLSQTYYICPICGKYSGYMELLYMEHNPTKLEMIRFPHIAKEILKCPCGAVLRWIDMRQIKIKE